MASEISHEYAEGNTLQSIVSTTETAVDATDGQIDGSSLSANTKYLIIARALFGGSNTTDRVHFRLATADDTDIATRSQTIMEPQQATSTSLKSWFFVHSFITDASPADLYFTAWTPDGNGSSDYVYADQYSLMAIDLDALGFYEHHESVPASLSVIGTVSGSGGVDEEVCQSFKVRKSDDLEYMMFLVNKTGSPTDGLKIEIATSVSGSVVATSDTIDEADMSGTSFETVLFPFSTPPSLTAGTQYYARIIRTGSRDTSNDYQIGGDPNGGYSDGGIFIKDSGSYGSDTNDDANFAAGSGAWVENIGPATGTELEVTQYGTDIALIPGSELGITDEWMILGYGRIGAGSAGNSIWLRLSGADDTSSTSQLQYVREETEDPLEYRMMGVVGRHKAVTSNVDVAVEASEEAANANHKNQGGYIIALNASMFEDFEHDYTSTSQDVSSETTIASVGPYTPATSGNHLVVGRAGDANSDNAQFITLHVEDGTTEIRTGDSTPSHAQSWDPTEDHETYFTMQRYSISSATTLNLRGANGGSLNNRWLLVLNLNGDFATSVQTISPALKQQIAIAYDPTNLARGAVSMTPAIHQQVAVAYDPTDLVQTNPEQFITSVLFQQLAISYDPTGLARGVVYIDPAVFQQIALAYDPTDLVEGPVYIDPSLWQQLATAYDPTLVAGPVYLDPILFQQVMVPYDPVFLWDEFIEPALHQQLAVAYDPTNLARGTVYIDLALYQQIAVAYDPTGLARGVVNIDPVLFQSLLTAYDPTVTWQVFIEPALHQQIATAYDPSDIVLGGLFIELVLYQQLVTAYDPTMAWEEFIEPVLYQSLITAFDAAINMSIAMDLVQQLMASYDPSLTYNYDIDPSSHQQFAAAFDPTLSPGEVVVSPTTVVSSAAAHDPTVTGLYSMSVDLVNQAIVVYDPTDLTQTIPEQFVEPALEQQLIAVYDPEVLEGAQIIYLTTVENLAQAHGLYIVGGETDSTMLTMHEGSP